MGSSKTSKVKPSEVASDTKRSFIPLVKARFAETYPPYSTLYPQPCRLPLIRYNLNIRPPVFRIEQGDPVMRTIAYANADTEESVSRGGPVVRIPFLCAASDSKPGGEWETGSSGYEENLCRRSNLSATLATPWPNTVATNYPIPSSGGILSKTVLVCRGPHDRYDKLDVWYDLPIISMPALRKPKLRDDGITFSFQAELDILQEKIRGALRICLYNGYDRIVIGDFGLGDKGLNPPRALAEMWRDIILFDPDLRGQFAYIVFVFEDACQSTTHLILDEIAKRNKSNKGSRSSSSKSKHGESSSSTRHGLTDMAIFAEIFDPAEVQRIATLPDPRYKLEMITT